jgi:hypothetical protein
MNSKIGKIGAVVLAIFLLGSMIALPISGAISIKSNNVTRILDKIWNYNEPDPQTENVDERAWLDRYHREDEDTSMATSHNDMGTNNDAGDTITRSAAFYPGEPTDAAPGRTRVGYLDPSDRDEDDFYRFAVGVGMSISWSFTTSENYDVEILDIGGDPISSGHTASQTDWYFAHVYTTAGGGLGQYNLDITVSGQNDAGTGNDAGDTIGDATPITPGTYEGWMDSDDWEDWYSFSANSGQGIFVSVEEFEKRHADFDIHLYNPSGEHVHSAMYYGANKLYTGQFQADKRLQYPADASGTWKIKIDMFPGWDTSKWPDDYFLYGSGPYELELSVGGTAEAPPGPIPQPEIKPRAQTFKITNDPNSNSDEYAFLAAVPSAVYKQGGKQYVSPVVYMGDNSQTSWFGTAQDTTDYLLDDWNTYLNRHGRTAVEYEVNGDPIIAAAEIATTGWDSSDTAVLAMDGSGATDVETVNIDKDATLTVKTKKDVLTPGDARFQDFPSPNSIQMWIGKEWGSMTLYAYGSDCEAIGLITSKYEIGTLEDWPHPYDEPGDNTNIYFPVAMPGLHWPYIDGATGFDTFEITKYSGDRYKIPITNTDSSIEVTVTTSSNSYLEVFLVDPQGSIRRPVVPSWNGGPINPIHKWNGDHHNGFEDWRRWEPDYSKEHKVEIHYPSKGRWTVIVTPHYPYGQEKSSDSIPYHIKAVVREHNAQRVDAGLSASNGAVLASQMHVPLLYVTENNVPVETQNALNQLGVKNIMFVNINGVSKAQPKGAVTEITSMKQVIAKTQAEANPRMVKASTQTGNVITITSFGSEDGYFAPAGYIAAYHGSNVIDIGEAAEAYNYLDKGTAWREYGGGWYHGCRAQGHLEKMDEPINVIQIIRDLLNGEFPPLGIDQHLRWWGATHDGIYEWVDDLGLTGAGKEVYLFVAPRNSDIRHPVCRIMSGVGSYAGQFPFDTPGLDAALMARDILYPAIIYANPGRDVTTSQLMNFPDGWTWRTNDGVSHTVYSTREVKESFSSHGRFFEGHVIWDNWLDRVNTGAAISYYSGHGTGGSGISCQFKNVAEQFPDADLRHEELHDFDWWDAWRGYMYDDSATKTARYGGFTWYNAKEPNLYDIVHYKWVDQQLQNMHSEIELWMSCTTGQHFGPEIYLEHGCALWYGNAGTGLCPQEDLLDDQWIGEMMRIGTSIGEAFSNYAWLHQRDFTAKQADSGKYNTALYGTSSLDITNVQVIYGDPTLTCYSPEWIEPIPI